jgi:hypothetical protein
MSKRTIIEQIQAHGAVAAHTTGRYVDIVNHVPVKVILATPIYMEKDKLRKGDKIAIVDTSENLAFICTVGRAEKSSVSKRQVLYLEKARKIRLE